MTWLTAKQASERWPGALWCHHTEPYHNTRGELAELGKSRVVSNDTLYYINLNQENAAWAPGEIGHYLNNLDNGVVDGRKGRGHRTTINVPGGYAVMSIWGNVTLTPIDANERSAWTLGQSPNGGITVDLIGDIIRSARIGLPIYKVTGGVGYVWIASDIHGHGHMRKFAIDGDSLANMQEPGMAYAPTSPPAEQSPISARQEPPLQRPPRGSTLQQQKLKVLIEEARRRGPEYASESGTSWELKEAVDEMTDGKTYSVLSHQGNQNVLMDVEGKCVDGTVSFTASFWEANNHQRSPTVGHEVRWRVNNATFEVKTLETPNFPNEYQLIAPSQVKNPTDGGLTEEVLLSMWALRVEFETSGGKLVAKIPMFNDNVQKFITSCRGS
jgi:hypothetical protein